MSVEKIVALNQATTDATTMRAVNTPASGHGRAPAPFPPPLAEPVAEGAAHLFDSLPLPLPVGGTTEVPSSRISASYRSQAARGLVEPLVEGRLPEALIRREVETLLRRFADTRAIDDLEETPAERLPSRNAANAHFDVKGRISATEEDGRLKLFDLYLTRVGPRQWESTIFERDPSRASQTFPRPTPPVDVHRLLFDPTAATVLACVAQKVPVGFDPPTTAYRGSGRALVHLVLVVTLLLLIAGAAPWPAAALFLVASAVLMLRRL